MLADDQALLRTAMRDVLLKESDVASVALANDGAQAIEPCRNDRADVAVLDIAMPGVNGIMALTALQLEQPKLSVVMLSTTADAYTVRNCLKLGAMGYVAKQSAYNELILAVRAVLAGEVYLCRVTRKSLGGQSS